MALALKPHILENHFPPFIILLHPTPSFPHRKPTKISLHLSTTPTRRRTLFSTLTIPTIFPDRRREKEANALDLFTMTVPDQTVEEAKSGIQFHAQSLLQVKELLELESWKEAQRELRKSSSLLKQDLYTIIQDKPGVERPQLRKLYSVLFNSVSRLDYAARDEDVTRVRECYDDIVVALHEILSIL